MNSNKLANKQLKTDSVNLSVFLQKAAKKLPNLLHRLAGRYVFRNAENSYNHIPNRRVNCCIGK